MNDLERDRAARRAKQFPRNQFLWSTVARFLIRHVENIEGRTGSISVFHLPPSLVHGSPKATLDPDVVLKYKSIGGSRLCDGFPNADVRARNGGASSGNCC